MGAAEKMVVQLSAQELEALMERVVARAMSARDSVELSHEQAAAQLGITPNALHKRIHRGLIKPDIRGGADGIRGNRFSQATIDAYKKRHDR